MELKRDNIRVQALLPGFTRTDFHTQMNARNQPTNGDSESRVPARKHTIVRFMRPEKVVDESLSALRRGKVICIPGFRNRVLAGVAKFLPRSLVYAIVSHWRG
jgi:hypothetical protein